MTEEAHKAKILILSYTTSASEPRVLKQLDLLSSRYDVTSAGFGSALTDGASRVELTQITAHNGSLLSRLWYVGLLALRQYTLLEKFDLRDRATINLLGDTEWDLVIAHDVKTIWAANRLKSRHGVLCDLHEYAPRQGDESWKWRLIIAPYFRWLVKREVRKARGVTTVSGGIVDEYKRVFGIDSELVINATPYQELSPNPVASPIRLVHSGTPSPGRRLETMIEAVRETTADVTLDLLLLDDRSAYLERLKKLAEGCDRIRFRDAVPYAELVATLNTYDVGISILPPVNFNHIHALPNKFFDYVQARIGVIIGPSPEMKRIVDTYGVGLVTEDFSLAALTRLLNELTLAKVEELKANSDRSAKELSSEEQVKVWGRMVERLLEAH